MTILRGKQNNKQSLLLSSIESFSFSMDFYNPQGFNDPKVSSNGNVVFHDPSNSKVFEDPKLISYGDMDFDIKKNAVIPQSLMVLSYIAF